MPSLALNLSFVTKYSEISVERTPHQHTFQIKYSNCVETLSWKREPRRLTNPRDVAFGAGGTHGLVDRPRVACKRRTRQYWARTGHHPSLHGRRASSAILERYHREHPGAKNNLDNYSSLTTMLRVTASVRCFIRNYWCQSQLTGELMAEEIADAERHWQRASQSETFWADVCALRASKPLDWTSVVAALNPFLDSDGVTRVGEWLQHSIDEDAKHSIILPPSHCCLPEYGICCPNCVSTTGSLEEGKQSSQ